MSEGARRRRIELQIGLGLFVALFGGVHGCRQKDPTPPRAKQVAPAAGISIFPDTPAGHDAASAVQAARKSGPGAEAEYQRSLQQLRSNGPEAVNVLDAGYRSTDPADYGSRALLVEILAELRQPEALPALTAIARTPVPPPVRGRNDLLNPFVEESVIRVTAIRGIGTFAAGYRQAQDTLLGLLDSNTAPVREEAARALWAASAQVEDRARQEAIRARIPAGLRVDPERKLGPIAPQRANPALKARTEKKAP